MFRTSMLRCLVLILVLATGAPTITVAQDQAIDSDGDGLSDAAEAAHGTDPAAPDSDADTVLDGREVSQGTDPLVADVAGGADDAPADDSTSPYDVDSDGDGLSDGEEVDTFFTDPDKQDTDGDRIQDHYELRSGYDPNDADSDDDGMADGDELAIESDPRDADTDDDGLADGLERDLGTRQTLADSDGDGLPDGYEWEYGYDPLTPDTDSGSADYGGVPSHVTPAVSSATNQGCGSPFVIICAEGPGSWIPDVMDWDGNGLADDEEGVMGIDPRNPDTDGDGIPDGAEFEEGMDPLVPHDSSSVDYGGMVVMPTDTPPPAGLIDCDDPRYAVVCYAEDASVSSVLDSDGDGLSNESEEDWYGSNPNRSDTDGDGLTDWEEIMYGQEGVGNPTKYDSDGDGLSDRQEHLLGTGWSDPDSDDDGVSDGTEVARGTNPLAADSSLRRCQSLFDAACYGIDEIPMITPGP